MTQKKSAKRHYKDLHGIILLDKPKGVSSNLALQKLRHLIKAQKAGHTGNLDPMATGLLPCCFGDATKVAHLLINSDKTYLARCVLGSQTDTGDATGEVIKTATKNTATDVEIAEACQALTGEIEQIPPMYSALNHQGQRLYQLARQGITVERPARKVTIYEFRPLENNNEYIDFEIKVSKGTYIRTLLEDFATQLGTVAHMTALHRIQTGIFSANGMKTIEDIAEIDDLKEVLLPMELALTEYPGITLTQEQTQDLIHGKQISYDNFDNTYVMMDDQDKFLGLGIVKNNRLRVKNIFMKSYLQSQAGTLHSTSQEKV
ncbi:MAG: tRNA pseudouridine(55) synthase TruB [Xanthomonadales bacterium]|nr:tRNA pseudouridine(55) synthase TruB [Xanthomonadales bacterium]